MKIGISGTMGAGKSTVSKYIESKGFIVFDADKIVHDLYDTQEMQCFLVNRFGKEVLSEGAVNRKILASKVFSDPKALADLEGKVYPMVKCFIEALDDALVFVEVPLLFEAGFDEIFDIILVVVAEQSIRYDRLLMRGLKMEDILNREALQYSCATKVSKADYSIDNSFTLEELYREVDAFLERVVHGKSL